MGAEIDQERLSRLQEEVKVDSEGGGTGNSAVTGISTPAVED